MEEQQFPIAKRDNHNQIAEVAWKVRAQDESKDDELGSKRHGVGSVENEVEADHDTQHVQSQHDRTRELITVVDDNSAKLEEGTQLQKQRRYS